MNAEKKSTILNGIKTYVPPYNAILVTIFLFMFKYEFTKWDDRWDRMETFMGTTATKSALDSQRMDTYEATQKTIIDNRNSDILLIQDTKQRVDVLYAILPTHK